jgi:hypothetical protein
MTIEHAATAPEFNILSEGPKAKEDLLGLTLTNGKSTGSASGLFVGVTVNLTNSNLSGTSGNTGGGIGNFGTLTLKNSTVTANRSDADANAIGFVGEIAIEGGLVTMFNTIVADNFNNISTARYDAGGAIPSASKNNLTGVDTGLTGVTNANQNRIGAAR